MQIDERNREMKKCLNKNRGQNLGVLKEVFLKHIKQYLNYYTCSVRAKGSIPFKHYVKIA